jgi:hypothetical protein
LHCFSCGHLPRYSCFVVVLDDWWWLWLLNSATPCLSYHLSLLLMSHCCVIMSFCVPLDVRLVCCECECHLHAACAPYSNFCPVWSGNWGVCGCI